MIRFYTSPESLLLGEILKLDKTFKEGLDLADGLVATKCKYIYVIRCNLLKK